MQAPTPTPRRTSGSTGPRTPSASSNPSGRGVGDHTVPLRPTPPTPGQTKPKDLIPFPNKNPMGRPAFASENISAASAANMSPEAIYFCDTQGNALNWTVNGPVMVEKNRACPFNFGHLATSDILLSKTGEWEIVRICKSPAYSRNLRPRWDVVLRKIIA